MATPEYLRIGYGTVIHDTKPDMLLVEIAIYEHVTIDKEYDKVLKEEEDTLNPLQLETAKDGKGNIIIAAGEDPDMTVMARWLNRGSNRITPPVLYAGTTVEVFKYKDTDRYYYEPLHLEPDLQGKEVVVFAFSNKDQKKKEDFGKPYDPDSSYTFTVSSIEKRVNFKTPKNDGEPISFDFNMDLAKGIVKFDAGNGQNITWDATNKKLDINIDTITLNGRAFTFNASSSITMNTTTLTAKASVFIHDAMCKFLKLCNHLKLVRFNGLSKTIGDEHKLY